MLSPGKEIGDDLAEVNRLRTIRISGDAIERVCDVAPGWDRYALETMYINWASDKDAARNEDARFLGWVRSYTKGKRAR
jgi:hypothetical protein